MNNDKLLKIAQSIEKHRKGELNMYATNNAIGLANVHYFKQDRKLWLVNNPNNRGNHIKKDALDNPVIVSGHKTTYEKDGHSIFKNSIIGGIIIRNSTGIHDVKTPTEKVHQLTIFNNSFYTPDYQPHYAKDLKINLNEKKPRYYSRLSDILQQIE